MVDITDEEAADLSPIESGPIKGEWIREVIDNPKLIDKIVNEVAESFDRAPKDMVQRIKDIIPTYDREDVGDFRDIIIYVVDRLGSPFSERVFQKEFMSRVFAEINEQVGYVREEALLEQNKLVPIHLPNNQGDFSAFLGGGAYGRVFRAAYKGKQVAVKVVNRGIEDDQWEKLRELSESAPSEIRKHLPIVHEIIQEKDKTLIVMEILKPINKDLSVFFYGENSSNRTSIKDIFDDQQLVWEMHDEVLRDSPIPNRSLSQELLKALLTFKGASVDELESFIKSHIGIPLSETQGFFINNYVNYMRRAIWKRTQERFPMSISENSDRFSRTPETSGYSHL